MFVFWSFQCVFWLFQLLFCMFSCLLCLCLTLTIKFLLLEQVSLKSFSTYSHYIFPEDVFFVCLCPFEFMFVRLAASGAGVQACNRCAEGFLMEEWRCVSSCSAGFYATQPIPEIADGHRICRRWANWCVFRCGWFVYWLMAGFILVVALVCFCLLWHSCLLLSACMKRE